MKRYSERMIYGAQADKHAALKELAAEVLPYIRPASFLREIKGIGTHEESEALYAKLKSLTETTP